MVTTNKPKWIEILQETYSLKYYARSSGIQTWLGILRFTRQLHPRRLWIMQKPQQRLPASWGVRPYLWREGNQGSCVESWPTARMEQTVSGRPKRSPVVSLPRHANEPQKSTSTTCQRMVQKRASFWPGTSNFYPQILWAFDYTLPGACSSMDGFRNEQVITLTLSLENVWHQKSLILPKTTNQFPWSQGALCTI